MMNFTTSSNPSNKQKSKRSIRIAEIRARGHLKAQPPRNASKSPSPYASHLSASDARSISPSPRASTPSLGRSPLPGPDSHLSPNMPSEMANLLQTRLPSGYALRKALEIAEELPTIAPKHFPYCDIEDMAEIIYRIKIVDKLKQQRQSVFESRDKMKLVLIGMGFSTDQVDRAFEPQSCEQKSQETTQYDLEEKTREMMGLRDQDRKKPYTRYTWEKMMSMAMTSSDFSLFDLMERDAAFPGDQSELVVTMADQFKRVHEQKWMLTGIVDELDELLNWVRGGLKHSNDCQLRRLEIEGVTEDMYDEISSTNHGEKHLEQFKDMGWRMHWSASTSLVCEKI